MSIETTLSAWSIQSLSILARVRNCRRTLGSTPSQLRQTPRR